MSCKYCFYHDVGRNRQVKSHGVMTHETLHAMLDNIESALVSGDEVTFAFQGGEPLLAGLAFFQVFVEKVQGFKSKVKVSYAIQTNGTLVNNQWTEFFKAHGFLVGLSIDANVGLHDLYRTYQDGGTTFKQVMEAKHQFDALEIPYNVLTVLTNEMAMRPKEVFDFLQKENIRFMQFIPCLAPLEFDECVGGGAEYALTTTHFARFYNELFGYWHHALMKGNYISIKLFDDVIYLLGTGRAVSCGMLGSCTNQWVIEADGSVYPCDFYAVDKYCMGNITTDDLEQMDASKALHQFLEEAHEALPVICQNHCEFWKMCYGGCRRMRGHSYVDPITNSCGYQQFLRQNIQELGRIAQLEHGTKE